MSDREKAIRYFQQSVDSAPVVRLSAIKERVDAYNTAIAALRAEEESRVVVLPCKMGEPIWYIRRMCKHADDTGYCNTDFWYAKKGIKKESGCPNCPHKAIENRIKETVFRLALLDEKRVGHLHVSECYFTRAEAEAALRNLDGGGQDG